MFTNDVSETALRLIERERTSRPSTPSARKEFVVTSVGQAWDILLRINVDANGSWMAEDADRLQSLELANESRRCPAVLARTWATGSRMLL